MFFGEKIMQYNINANESVNELLKVASQTANELNGGEIATEYLLYGILKLNNSKAQKFLSDYGVHDEEFLEILKEKGKTKYWLYIRLGLSYQNFNRIINNETKSIKFENLEALCDILECTPNDLFEEYHKKIN